MMPEMDSAVPFLWKIAVSTCWVVDRALTVVMEGWSASDGGVYLHLEVAADEELARHDGRGNAESDEYTCCRLL